MGFFSDLFEGNFGNLWHDIRADPIAETGLLAGGALLTGGLLAPELLAGAGGLFGAGEAAGGLAGSALAGAEVGGAAGGINLADLGLAGGGGALEAIESAFPTGGGSPPGNTPSGVMSFAPDAAGGGAPAGGGTDPLISQILSEEKGFVQGLPDASGGGSGNVVTDLLSGAGNQIMKNPIGTAAAAGGLGLSLLSGNKGEQGHDLDQMKQLAAKYGMSADQMQSYLKTGTLPPGLQTGVNQAVAAAKARIIANHAQQGQSTDPTQNSALAQELSNVELQVQAQVAQIAQSLYNQGIQMAQLDANLLNAIYAGDRQQAQDISAALMNFAKALAPSGPTFKLA